jgi:putative membrane protein
VSGPPGGRPRRPRWVYDVGTDPDVRFSLANERTALAWTRTGLALVAGGIALTSASRVADLPSFLDVVAAISCLIGGALAVRAAVGWARTERAIRLDQPLPAPRSLTLLTAVVVVIALVMAGYALAALG